MNDNGVINILFYTGNTNAIRAVITLNAFITLLALITLGSGWALLAVITTRPLWALNASFTLWALLSGRADNFFQGADLSLARSQRE